MKQQIHISYDDDCSPSGVGHTVVGTPVSADEMKHLIVRQHEFLSKVFAWMFCGLSVTAGTAYFVNTSTTAQAYLAAHRGLIPVLFLIQLICVSCISVARVKANAKFASAIFLGYSFTTGITLEPFLAQYTQGSIVLAFGIAAGLFLSMAVYGYVTKRDLTAVGSLALASLWGLLLAMILNLFLGSPLMDWILSVICVVLFVGITAYDTQRLKELTLELATESEMETAAVVGALLLYLDFINLFIHILKLLGKKK